MVYSEAQKVCIQKCITQMLTINYIISGSISNVYLKPTCKHKTHPKSYPNPQSLNHITDQSHKSKLLQIKNAKNKAKYINIEHKITPTCSKSSASSPPFFQHQKWGKGMGYSWASSSGMKFESAV